MHCLCTAAHIRAYGSSAFGDTSHTQKECKHEEIGMPLSTTRPLLHQCSMVVRYYLSC